MKPKKPGRKPLFDRATVIANAREAFWATGYDGTSLEDLEKATGVDRSTIYNSFGGKKGLYRTVNQSYIDTAEDLLFHPLYSGTAGLDDILAVFGMLKKVLVNHEPTGCLIVNSIALNTDTQASDRYLKLAENGFTAALERAAALGEIDPTHTPGRASMLTATIVGLNITANNANYEKTLAASIQNIANEIDTWRADDSLSSMP